MRYLLSSLVVSYLMMFASIANAIELAPFFRGYTFACEIRNKSGKEIIKWLAPIDATGSVGTKPALPANLSAALGKPVVLDKEYHWLYTVALEAATFNGVSASAIKRWYGKDNGIIGFAIVFDAPVPVIKAAFKHVRFTTDESPMQATRVIAELVFDEATGKSSLICDSSN